VSFDRAGVVGQGQAGQDGVVVAAQSGGEGVQVGLVVGVDGGDPGVELVPQTAGEDLGERLAWRARAARCGQAVSRPARRARSSGCQLVGVSQ
jgi:hypothetical protein